MTALLVECARVGEYNDWAELKAALLQRLDEVVPVFEEFDRRRLSLLAGGAALSDAAQRTVRAGLHELPIRIAELRAALNAFRRR
jgi:hypothetical protein